MKWVILFFVLITYNNLFSQQNIKEANQFFYKKEYTKAIEQYKILEKEHLTTIYKNYLTSLIKVSDYKKANYIIGKQIISFPKNPIYKIDKGYMYLLQNKKDKAYSIFNKIIYNTKKYSKNTIVNAGNKFAEIEEYNFAIKILEGGSDIYPEFKFELQIANIYRKKGETEKMINTYIKIIKTNPDYKQHALNTFQNVFGRDGSESNKKYELLKKNLIKDLQKSNNKEILEMIIWTYIQQHEFENAFKYSWFGFSYTVPKYLLP